MLSRNFDGYFKSCTEKVQRIRMYGKQELLSYLSPLNGAGLAEVDVDILAKPGRVVISHRFRISECCNKHQ
jgi:hypothetical protein